MNTEPTLYEKVVALTKTPAIKDGTYLSDYINEGDTDGMTPAEIAAEWDALPEMERDNE